MNNKVIQFAEAYNVKQMTTQAMQEAIGDWYDLYYGFNVPADEDPSQKLPVAIVNKLTKAVFSEYSAEANNDFAQEVIDALDKVRKKAVQQALIGGVSFIKPLIFGDELQFTVIPRNNCIILGRDDAGIVTDIGTMETTEAFEKYFTLYERRTVIDKKLYIDTRLFASDDSNTLGERVPLSTLPKYEGIDDVNEINIDNIGLIAVVCPQENTVDGSDDPVCVYASATGLIHNINLNEAQLNTEFANGESRIVVSNDLLKKGPNGERALTDNVYVGVDDDPENVGINIFSPALRDVSFLNRKKEYLRNVETLIGLKRGLLADVQDVQRTATEIASSAGDYNLTVIDFQQMWESALRYAIEVCTKLYGAYNQKKQETRQEDIVVGWGNGVLYDRDKTFGEYLAMVQAGMLKPEIAVAYYFNIDWNTPADLDKIKSEYMPQLATLLEG